MTFSFPTAAYLMLPLCAALVWTLRSRASRSLRSITAALLRLGACAALVAALAGPYEQRDLPADTLVAFLDVSSSITPQQGDSLLKRARSLAEKLGVPLSVVPFAKDIAPATIPVGAQDRYTSIRESWEKLNTGASNLAQIASFTAPSSLALLLSDGYETTGHIRESSFTPTLLRVFPVTAPGESSDQEITVSQLTAPLTVRAQKSVDIRTTLTNTRSQPQTGTLEITHGDRVVLSQSVTIPGGQDLSVVAQSDPALEGLRTIQATFSWRDTTGDHSSTRTIWLSGEKRDKVLLISGSPDDDRFMSQILRNQSYQLRSLTVGTPLDQGESLADFRALVLNNVAYADIPERVRTALASYVRGGGGLVTIGGNKSYGLGGYIGTSTEELLPVRLVQPHQEKKRLNVAVQLVLDKSRSMATDSRLEFAKAAAEEVVRNLADDDYIGVIGFDDVPFIALPVSPLAQVRDSAVSRISRLFPTSRTNLFPALDEARRGLARVNAGRKHVIVLTDGKLPDPGPYYFELLKQMRILGVTVSTVMVGNDADDGFLAQMAQAGGGAFYQTTDPSNLPKVFLSDVKVASGERTLKEEPDVAVRPGPDPLVSTNLSSFPTLRGFVETLQKDAAQTELVVSNLEGTYPLLASWKVGEGHVISFTSDANGRWSSNWMRWDRIQEFWSDIIESARRKIAAKEATVPFDMRSWVEGSEMVVDLSLFEDTGYKEVTASIKTPSGAIKKLAFSPISRGHYQARLPDAIAGTYRTTVSLGDATLPEVAWTLSGELFGERSFRKPNLSILSDIAERSGGKVDPSADEIRPLLRQATERSSLAHLFLITALVLLFAEFGIRALPSGAGLRPRR